MKKILSLFLLLALVAGGNAQTAPALGTANLFGLLSGGTVSATDTITAIGNAGAGTALSGYVKATTKYTGGTTVSTAITDLGTAKGLCTAQTGTSVSGTLGTQTFAAGVYSITGNATLYDTLTLTGDTSSVFIFNITGNFNSDSMGVMNALGIMPSKIYWNIGGTTTMGLYSNVSGTVLSAGAISLAGVCTGSLTLLSQAGIALTGPEVLNHPADYGYRLASHLRMAVRDLSVGCTDPLTACNLVSNPGMEVVDDCPNDGGLYHACEWGAYADWPHTFHFGNVCNMFGTCNDPIGIPDYGVVNNIFGAQAPHTGDNYAGFAAYMHFPYLPTMGSASTFNWFVKDLGTPLTPGVPYYVEYYVSLSDNSTQTAPLEVLAAIDAMDVLSLSAESIFTTTAITSTSTWTKIAGCFTPVRPNQQGIVMKFSTGPTTYTAVTPAHSPGSHWTGPYPPDEYAFYYVDDMTVRRIADAGPDATVCSGATLGAGCTPIAGASYSWNVSGGGSGVSFSSTAVAEPVVTFTLPGTYTFTVTVTYGGCTATDAAVITATVPNVTITPATPSICPGDAVVLTASGASAYSWAGGPATAADTVSPGTTTTYTVTGTNGSCSGTATVTVTVNPVPTISASAPVTINLGSGTTLTSSSSTGTYTWAPAGTLSDPAISNPVATPPYTTTYTVTTSNGSCSASATTTVTVVNAACGLHINTTINSDSNSDPTFGSGSVTVNGSNIHIASGVTLTITNDIVFTGCNFLMDAGAKIVVSANYTLTITDKTHMFSCSDMWDGIYVISQGKLIIQSSAFIEDATNAVVSQSGGKFTINTAIFNKNLKAVDVQSFGAAHPGTIVNSIVTSRYIPSFVSANNTSNYSAANLISFPLTGFTAANMISPNTSFKGVYGVMATDVSSIGLGAAAASSTNTFDAIMCGIFLTRSNAVVYNNHFQYLLNPTFTSCFPGPCYNVTGYGVKAAGAASGTYSITIGGAGSNQPNSFYNCYRAVELDNYQSNTVSQNSIDNATTAAGATTGYGNVGIYVQPASNNTVVINHNSPFNNCATAIWVNRAFASAISTNVLQINGNGTAANPITANSSGYCTNGIYVTDLLAGTSVVPSTSEIKNNVITECANGISLSNVKKNINVITNSCSVLYNPTPGVNTNGIIAVGCDGVNISNNHTKYNNASGHPYSYEALGNIASYGIYLQNSTNMLVKCNQVDDAARSLVFYGTCTSPLTTNASPTVGITQNTMTNAQDGFVLLTSGTIGSQGSSTVASDNVWNLSSTFTNSQTFTDNTTGANTNSKLFMNTASVPFPTLNGTSLTGNQYISIGTGPGLNASMGTPTACGTIPALITIHSGLRDVIMDTVYSNELASMEEDTITLAVYNAASHWQRRNFVYNEIKHNTVLTNNTALAGFYTANASTSIGQFASISDDIASGDYSAANNLNNSITPDITLEQNQQTVNTLILQTLADSNYVYTSTDSSVLYSIASQCPAAGGNAVYQARNLLMTLAKAFIEFPEVCDETPKSFSGIKTGVKNDQDGLFKLYPNPNNGTMILDYKIASADVAVMQLFDLTGKLIGTYELNSSADKLQISNNKLNNGIYFYSIVINNKTMKQDKLVIIK